MDVLLKESNSVKSNDGQIIINRCQRYIEAISGNNNYSSDIVRGAILLLKHIKQAESDYLQEKAKNTK